MRGQAINQTVTLPAPTGGINTISPIGAMPTTDLVASNNVIAAELGLRVRLGWKELATSVQGSVRSLHPFGGSHSNGSTDLLFASSSQGITDVTAGGDSLPLAFNFGNVTGEAGYGVSTVVSTPGGRFLALCDEVNGLHVYSENTTTWTRVPSGVTAPWAALTAVLVGNKVVNGSNAYVCTVAGVTAASGGPTGQGTAIVDGTAHWDFYQGPWAASTTYAVGARVVNGSSPARIYVCTTGGASAASGGPTGTGTGIVDNVARWNYVADYSTPIGPSLADQQLGYSALPANFVYPVVWKSRLWLVERDSTRAWYLPVNSLFGTATSFDFGSRMRAGGPLAGLYNWSYDAGNGLDSLLVAIGTAGDVVMYAGTDPSSASTFGLKGTWSVGAVPYGRRIASEFGGDLLVMSTSGIVPMSRLVVGQPVVGGDRSVYATDKISNTFALAVSSNRLLPGWQMVIHPEENALMVLLPSAAGAEMNVLAMSSATKGWFPLSGLGMYCAASFQGKLYYGTPDSRVCVNTGYLDGILLTDPTAFTPVNFNFLSAFSNLGNPRQKRVMMLLPSVLSRSPGQPLSCTARYNFDTSSIAPVASAVESNAGSLWDTAKWDAGKWAGDYQPIQQTAGGFGMGRSIAVAVSGQATDRTVFASVDIIYQEGGLL